MKLEGSSPHSQGHATCPYPELAPSSPHTHIHFSKINLNIILPSMPGSPSGLLPSGFLTKTLYTPLLSPIRATCPAHLIILDFITRTILGEVYRLFSSSLCNFLHSPVTSSLLGSNILLITLFSNTLSLRSYLNVSDQVSHPYNTTSKITVLNILMFKTAIPLLLSYVIMVRSGTWPSVPPSTALRIVPAITERFVISC